jgi:hypothetical protein
VDYCRVSLGKAPREKPELDPAADKNSQRRRLAVGSVRGAPVYSNWAAMSRRLQERALRPEEAVHRATQLVLRFDTV